MKNKQTENKQQFFVFICTTNSGKDGGNDGGNGGGGSKKKDHSLFVYVLIGLIVLAAISLVILIIKIRRYKGMLSFIISEQLELS